MATDDLNTGITAEFLEQLPTMSTVAATRVDAILPAGGRITGEFAREAGAEIKALVEFADVSILTATLRILRSVDTVGRVVVIGPKETHKPALDAEADAALDEGATGPENIFRGMEWLQSQPDPAPRVLIVTTDMPFLHAEAVRRFLNACPDDRDICVPVVERGPFEAVYPGLIRTDTRLQDGWFRLGGLFLLDPATLIRNRAHLDSVFAARKSNLKMAQLIGLRTAIRYATGRLSSKDILDRAAQILNCTGAVIKDMMPEIAFDIDLIDEYQYAVGRFAAYGYEPDA